MTHYECIKDETFTEIQENFDEINDKVNTVNSQEIQKNFEVNRILNTLSKFQLVKNYRSDILNLLNLSKFSSGTFARKNMYEQKFLN